MFGYKKVGGLRFLRIGRLNISWSVKRKIKRPTVYNVTTYKGIPIYD